MSERTNRLLKNAHLLRYPHSSSLRRTSVYGSLFGISGALHLHVFEQPEEHVFFSNLIVLRPGRLPSHGEAGRYVGLIQRIYETEHWLKEADNASFGSAAATP